MAIIAQEIKIAQIPNPKIAESDPQKLEKKKISDYVRNKFLTLFEKTFAKPETDKSLFYNLYLEFINKADITFLSDITFDQISNSNKDGIRAFIYSGAQIRGKDKIVRSKITTTENNKPQTFKVITNLRAGSFNPDDLTMGNLELAISIEYKLTATDHELNWLVPKNQELYESNTCTLFINPNNPKQVTVNCNPNTIRLIGSLKIEEVFGFRAEKSLTYEARRSIEFLILALQTIFPDESETKILERLHQQGRIVIESGRTSYKSWVFYVDGSKYLRDTARKIQNIIQNPQKTASIGDFSFNLIPDLILSKFSDLNNPEANSNISKTRV